VKVTSLFLQHSSLSSNTTYILPIIRVSAILVLYKSEDYLVYSKVGRFQLYCFLGLNFLAVSLGKLTVIKANKKRVGSRFNKMGRCAFLTNLLSFTLLLVLIPFS
jgi:hypothetical protein